MESMGNGLLRSALAILFCVSASAQSLAADQEPPPPEDGIIAGASHAYYGKDQGGWVDLRKQFRDLRLYGRRGQRQILHVLDGQYEEAVSDCESYLASEPNDLESLFNLTVARCQLKDYAGAVKSMTRALEGGLPLTRFLAGPRQLLEPLRRTEEFRRYAAQADLQLIHGPMLGSITDTRVRV